MKLKSATVLLGDQWGRILAITRGRNLDDLGMPGGFIEAGETPEQAAARELYEETGIVAQPEQLVEVYRQAGCVTFTPRGPVQMPPYLASEPFEGYVYWVEPHEIACESCTFGLSNARMLRDLGLLA